MHANRTYPSAGLDTAIGTEDRRQAEIDTDRPGKLTQGQIDNFLQAWHENGRASFKRRCPNSYANGSYDRRKGEGKWTETRRKYVALNKGGSGVFLVDRKTGMVFTIAAYGRPKHMIGYIDKLAADYRRATEDRAYREGRSGEPLDPELARHSEDYDRGWDAGNCDRPSLDDLTVDAAKERTDPLGY
jgi:hypothetical protein